MTTVIHKLQQEFPQHVVEEVRSPVEYLRRYYEIVAEENARPVSPRVKCLKKSTLVLALFGLRIEDFKDEIEQPELGGIYTPRGMGTQGQVGFNHPEGNSAHFQGSDYSSVFVSQRKLLYLPPPIATETPREGWTLWVYDETTLDGTYVDGILNRHNVLLCPNEYPKSLAVKLLEKDQLTWKDYGTLVFRNAREIWDRETGGGSRLTPHRYVKNDFWRSFESAEEALEYMKPSMEVGEVKGVGKGYLKSVRLAHRIAQVMFVETEFGVEMREGLVYDPKKEESLTDVYGRLKRKYDWSEGLWGI